MAGQGEGRDVVKGTDSAPDTDTGTDTGTRTARGGPTATPGPAGHADGGSPSSMTPTRSPEDTLRIVKAFANPVRMKVMRTLALGDAMRVSDVARAVGAPANSVSYHLRQLERVGIVRRAAPEEGRDARETWWQEADWGGLSLDWQTLDAIPGGLAALGGLTDILGADAAELFASGPAGPPGWPGLQADTNLRLTHDEAESLVGNIKTLVDAAIATSRAHAASQRVDAHPYDLRIILRARTVAGGAGGNSGSAGAGAGARNGSDEGGAGAG